MGGFDGGTTGHLYDGVFHETVASHTTVLASLRVRRKQNESATSAVGSEALFCFGAVPKRCSLPLFTWISLLTLRPRCDFDSCNRLSEDGEAAVRAALPWVGTVY